jgi:uncharacterized membrane protein YjjB (DUF3815 family)
MHTTARLYLALFPFLPFAPFAVAIVAGCIAAQMSKRKWIVHSFAVAPLFLAFPSYILTQGIIEPTTIQYPGPGDGLVLLLYVINLLPTLLIYSTYAWFTRSKSLKVEQRPMTN